MREHRNAVYTVTAAKADSAADPVLRRLGEFGALVKESHLLDETSPELAGRNLWTRSLDKFLKALRRYTRPLHIVGYMRQLREFLLGSIATAVVSRAHCTVEVVRDGF